MATIVPRPRKGGGMSYRVLGRINGRQVGETFKADDDAVAHKAATEFAKLAKRVGFAAAVAVRNERSGRTPTEQSVPTVHEWVRQHIDELSGVTTGSRKDYHRINDQWIDGTALGALPLDAVKKTHVRAWVRAQEERWPKVDRRGRKVLAADGKPIMLRTAAKTIRNRHGLLSAAFEAATEEDPPLREDNPCRGTKIAETLKRTKVFLTPLEFGLILEQLTARWRPLALTLVGTGARFSEITALPVHAVHVDDALPSIHIYRAWKWDGSNNSTELGPPKTDAGVRTVYLGKQVELMLRLACDGKDDDDLVFATASGKRITTPNFYDLAWSAAVAAARATHDADGNPKPAAQILRKKPRVHDLRHTYAAWQIARGTDLNVIRDQLGHESITTTVDVYGHLNPNAGRIAAAAVDASLGVPIDIPPALTATAEPVPDPYEWDIADDEEAVGDAELIDDDDDVE